jgi:hypothetical protein
MDCSNNIKPPNIPTRHHATTTCCAAAKAQQQSSVRKVEDTTNATAVGPPPAPNGDKTIQLEKCLYTEQTAIEGVGRGTTPPSSHCNDGTAGPKSGLENPSVVVILTAAGKTMLDLPRLGPTTAIC